MAIYKGGNEISDVYVGSSKASAVYLGSNKIRPNTEYISYKITADSNGNLYVPTAGRNRGVSVFASYDWNVSVDGGTAVNYTGTGSGGSSITLSGYTAGTDHIITIVPTTEAYGWALAYGWESTQGSSYLKEVIYDESYMGYADSATSTGNYFRCYQYRGCTSLTTAPAEALPNTVTSIGTYFRYNQYSGCTSLTTAPAEVLPSTVTSIGTYFRGYQYNSCTSLTAINGWKDLSIGGVNYRRRQFYGCSSNKRVAVDTNVGYASYDANTLQNSYVTNVYVLSTYLQNFKDATIQPRSGITDSKFVGM